VRVAGDTINIRGNIGGDLVIAGDEVDLTSAAEIGRDLVFAANKMDINTLIGSSIQGYGNRVNLNDGVIGDVELGVDRLTIANTANIQGNLTYTSENEANIEPGAQIGGTVNHFDIRNALRETGADKTHAAVPNCFSPIIAPWAKMTAPIKENILAKGIRAATAADGSAIRIIELIPFMIKNQIVICHNPKREPHHLLDSLCHIFVKPLNHVLSFTS
ncbi:hypothetical protein ACFLWZ_08205, partial [Chloroflexota bacterium]